MQTTTISQKGQIVVPKEIRERLNIKPADTLTVSLEGNKIIVEPVLSVDEAHGMFETKRIISKNDIKEAIRKAMDIKFVKSTK